ncbi:SIR2 family protein [Novosphingobium sp.]|uniref:SIR2 family protein n=1 Tax=Novosphingobium sp. TaxID=1874826 RepID=UPI002619D566|nr:SIR2 family protein [Novosphingobium sp.]
MEISPFDEFERRLNLARKGGGVLFCGAGYSADCLNFAADETLGTGAQLLELFNKELRQDPPYRDLQNASDALHDKLADYGMMQLLQKRFLVSNVTSDMTDLLRFPWQTIYTTNYDNGLEIAAQAAKIRVDDLNNSDDPKVKTTKLPIIHLHGYVQKWNIDNFRESCVLGAESYTKLTRVQMWLDRFRRDIDQAQIVVFVGFNAGDFHLSKAIYDLTGLREKAFFINRPTAQANPDVTAAQKRLGTPFFIGRTEFAKYLNDLLKKDAPKDPLLASFSKYIPADPATTIPTEGQIEELFIYGDPDFSQLARDLTNNVSEYHVQRSALRSVLGAIEDGVRIVLFDGFPCDGKSVLITDLAYRLSGTRPVYQMRQPYENILDEIAGIVHHAPNAALIIENCFDLSQERLASITRQFDGSEGLLVLTSRAVAVDASPAGLASLKGLKSFRRIPLARLDDVETATLIDLADQIAGWREFRGFDLNARRRFIEITCQSSLPHFLMRLLRSEYVTTRYQEEFNKLSLSQREREAVIMALYIAHIGENAPVSFLSNATEVDYGAIIDKLSNRLGGETFRLVRRNGNVIQTVPSIGAENILRSLFKDSDIVDAIVPVLDNLASTFRNDFEQRMFSQLMRFSILSNIVEDPKEIDRFFDNNRQKPEIRRMPLFWLQWHMAKCSSGELTVAGKFLEQGYKEAAEYERRTGRKFDLRQLDDRRAKFLMQRVSQQNLTGALLFSAFKESIELTEKILRQDDPKHYPFETIIEIVNQFSDKGDCFLSGHKDFVSRILDQLISYAEKRVGVLADGYQGDKARSALREAVAGFR